MKQIVFIEGPLLNIEKKALSEKAGFFSLGYFQHKIKIGDINLEDPLEVKLGECYEESYPQELSDELLKRVLKKNSFDTIYLQGYLQELSTFLDHYTKIAKELGYEVRIS